MSGSTWLVLDPGTFLHINKAGIMILPQDTHLSNCKQYNYISQCKKYAYHDNITASSIPIPCLHGQLNSSHIVSHTAIDYST